MRRIPAKTRANAKRAGLDLRTREGKQFINRSLAARKGWRTRKLWLHTYAITYPYRTTHGGDYYSFVGRRWSKKKPGDREIQYFRRRTIQKLRESVLRDPSKNLWFSPKATANEQIDQIKTTIKLAKGAIARENFEDERTGEARTFAKRWAPQHRPGRSKGRVKMPKGKRR